jgi:uncharacterized SAM-binding protein YcdF (DUF218 family)
MAGLSPLTLVLLGLLVAFAALPGARRRLALGGLLLGLLGLAMMTPLVANALVGAIERRAGPAAGDCGPLDAVVLLSGGLQRAAGDAGDFAALTTESVARVFAFADAPRSTLPLLIAGGGPYPLAEAEVLAALLERIGVTPDERLLDTRSLNTWENARESARLLLPDRRRIALASSALHLPRARRAFIDAGFEVCSWPLNRRYVAADGIGAFWPQSSALLKTEAALHELAGQAYYRARLLWAQW